MPDIFLSYNREDQARAKLFAEAFLAAGFDVWWDTALRSGEAYDEVTERALRGAKAVVVLWSKRSVESRWVRAEATLADRNKTLVPAMVEPCERPIMFELTQTAELSHWHGAADDRAWLTFVDDVRRFIARAPSAPAPAATLRQIAAEPAPPAETTLAVLSFDNLSADADMVFFSDGVSEDILTRLSRGSPLKLIGKTSSFQFRGADKPKAAAALKATHVLDGSIRCAANKVRIAAHLTEAASQTMLWSEKYDRGLDDIFDLQDEISEAIAEALKTSFAPAKAAPAITPALYDLYLRAVRELPTNNDDRRRRIAELEAVTAGAPDFVDAWASLAAHRGMLAHELPYTERAALRASAIAAVERTLALDPKNASIWTTRYSLGDPFEDYALLAECEAPVAEQANPFAFGALSVCIQGVGRVRDAAEYARRAYELDSFNPIATTQRGLTLFWTGRYAEARVVLERTYALWPDNQHNAAILILLCALQQDWAAVDALIAPERLQQHSLQEHAFVVPLAGAFRDPGPEPRRMLLEVVRSRALQTGHAEVSTFVFVAALGFVDEAFDTLDQIKLGPAGARSDALGPNAYRTHLLFQAAYPELRNDPRFVKLCARLGLVDYWLTSGKWPDCADEVPYDFRAECEKYRDYPKDVFFAG